MHAALTSTCVFAPVKKRSRSPMSSGVGSSVTRRSVVRSSMQSMGRERPVPRGSKVTMSNRSRMVSGIVSMASG
jgi:hypothetical protein